MKIIIFDTETTGLLKPKVRKLSEQPFITEYCFKKYNLVRSVKEGVCSESGSVTPDDIMWKVDNFFVEGLTPESRWELKGFLKIPFPVPKVITKITGITDKDLVDAPKFIDKVDEIANFFLGVDVLVAHNLPFDRSMLANELLRIDKVLNFPWPPRHICTVEETLGIKGYRLSLTKLYAHLFNGETFSAHRATDDVNALSRCFFDLVMQGIIKL